MAATKSSEGFGPGFGGRRRHMVVRRDINVATSLAPEGRTAVEAVHDEVPTTAGAGQDRR